MASTGFVATIIPLGLFLLPFTPRLYKMKTTPSTKAIGTTVRRNRGDQPVGPTRLPMANMLLRRPVVCILQGRHFRKINFYEVTNLPWSFCTAIVYSAYGINPAYRLGTHEENYVARLASQASTFRTSSGKRIPLLLGFGGDDTQHPKLSRLASNLAQLSSALLNFVRSVIEPNNISGVHIEWQYPGARCGTPEDKNRLYAMLQLFKASKPDIVLSVVLPNNDAAIRRGYNLSNIFSITDYVIASSEVQALVPGALQETVHCRNNGTEAALLVQKINQRIPSGRLRKELLCYTAQLSASTFIADSADMGAKNLGQAPRQTITATPGKAGYFELCNNSWTIHPPQDRECSVVSKVRSRH
ncbi:unnamed protein product [Ixodes hexagonus]